jgi:hypothetical protein
MPGLVLPCAGHPRLETGIKRKTWMAETTLAAYGGSPGHDDVVGLSKRM